MKRGLLLVILILIGCGGKKHTPAPDITPSKALLNTPAQNEVCTTGSIISAKESAVTFAWDASNNTSSYTLTLKDLLNDTTYVQNTAQTQLTITLLRNTPYSWFITSKSTRTSVIAQSDTWKFYNAGPGVLTYAPFPAEITSPTFGQIVNAPSGTINLTWNGSSVSPGTIANYDVYFGTTDTPSLLQGVITESFINNVSVISGTTYYWKVITRDIQGDTSDSSVYQFTVN